MAKRKKKPKYRDPDLLYKCPECGFIGTLDDYDGCCPDAADIMCVDDELLKDRGVENILWCNACNAEVDPIAVEQKQPTLF